MAIDGATIGWAGGFFGAILGLMGGAVGTAVSVRDAAPGPQRSFMLQTARFAVGAMLGLFALILAVSFGLLPQWVYWSFLAAWFVSLGPAILYVNRRYAALAPHPIETPAIDGPANEAPAIEATEGLPG